MSEPTSKANAAIATVDACLRGRRTVHGFKPSPPPIELVREALDLARFAPNHRHTEPWRFHLIGRRTAEKICVLNSAAVREKKGADAARKKLERWLAMPGWLAISSCTSADDIVRHQEDYAACCCAAQNLALALWARGIGLKWITGDLVQSQEFHDLLGLHMSERYCIGLYWYGYPLEIPETKRKPLEEVLVTLD